jgi:hypothetical protein
MAELKLPVFTSTECTTAEFLADPEIAFNRLGTSIYYVSLGSSEDRPDLPRQRTFGLGREGIVDFVDQTTYAKGLEYDKLILMETAKLLYGGNIVVDTGAKATIYGELTDGTHSDLVGGKSPIVTLRRNPFNQRFEYQPFTEAGYASPDFDEEAIRRGFYRAAMSIPHQTTDDHGIGFENRSLRFHPGYYEFALVQKRTGGPLEPVFIDYSDERPFLFDDSDSLEPVY